METNIAAPKNHTSSKGLQLNVGAIERTISVAGGSYLLVNSIAKKEMTVVKTLAAALLLFRGLTGHCPAYKAIGKNEIDYHPKNINIKTTLTVNKPRHEVYGFWRRLENLPRYMKHLEKVTVIDENISEWKAKMPGGLGAITWRSQIVKDEPGALLSWQSVPGSGIENAGKIEFSDAGNFGTEVHTVLSYHAPLGIIGEQAAKLLNPVFEAMVKEDIKNLKRFLETGEIPTIEGQPSGRKK
jgi:uncharacterized membrane protein